MQVIIPQLVINATKAAEMNLEVLLEKSISDKLGMRIKSKLSEKEYEVEILKGEKKKFKVLDFDANEPEERVILAVAYASDTVYGMDNALSDREKLVLKMKYDENKKNNEIAKELNISPQAVSTFLRRIKSKMWGQFARIYSS